MRFRWGRRAPRSEPTKHYPINSKSAPSGTKSKGQVEEMQDRVAKAREVYARQCAVRRAHDPVLLRRAIHTVQAALDEGIITAEDIAAVEK